MWNWYEWAWLAALALCLTENFTTLFTMSHIKWAKCRKPKEVSVFIKSITQWGGLRIDIFFSFLFFFWAVIVSRIIHCFSRDEAVRLLPCAQYCVLIFFWEISSPLSSNVLFTAPIQQSINLNMSCYLVSKIFSPNTGKLFWNI